MCGIIGIIGKREVAPLLLEGLRRLEYRGYDSAGVATLVGKGIERRRAEGRLDNLAERLEREPLSGKTGIGHTRWATHGRPTERNAHPHATDKVAIVHNGIIENFHELRDELVAKGIRFETDTDTEAVAHLLTVSLNDGATPEQAMADAMDRLRGAFSLAVVFAGQPDLMIGARRGSPLAVGYGDGEMYIGTDALALASLTRRITYLEEDDWVVLSPQGVRIFNQRQPVERPVKETALSGALIGKGNYPHFMLKEICEQPAVIGDTLQSFLNPLTRQVQLPKLPFDFATVPKITIVACGTAYLAGLVAKYWFESVARLPVEVDIASEFRYRAAPMPDGGVTIAISQSGETIDTLAALQYAKSQGQICLAIVNVLESVIARESHAVLQTLAGPEIGVASTKAFTTQLTVLAVLAIAAARARGKLTAEREAQLCAALIATPAKVTEIISQEDAIERVANAVVKARDVLFLGRGSSYPIALEGALKLKEISYIHAEGYAAGEMKHGPIALIDENVPVVVMAPLDEVFDKTASNVEQVEARGGKLVLFSNASGIKRLGGRAVASMALPETDPFTAPILYAIPAQLLAYRVAVMKGTDVDKPRNLAKAVTVE
ncbi:MAG: glmS [Alphaproteobacteria bacterium]|jgi:glucosamine--fructose-6-phosphate aminotransferase (isomerizing)|nr:glmS [Alphaproteobacteria bacterium]